MQVFATIVDELATRGALASALSGRDAESLLPVLEHMHRHVTDPRYAPTTSVVCHHILDMYGGLGGDDAGSEALVAQLELLRERVQLEIRVQEELSCLRGMLEPLMSASSL